MECWLFCFNPSQGIISFATNSGIFARRIAVSDTEICPTNSTSTCTLQTLHPRDPFICATCQQKACNYQHPIRGKLCCWVEEFPPIVHINSVRTTTLCRSDVNNIEELSFGFIDQFVLFSCEWNDIPVGSFQSLAYCEIAICAWFWSREQILTAVLICLSRCVADVMCCLQLWIADGVTASNLSNGFLCLKPDHGCWSRLSRLVALDDVFKAQFGSAGSTRRVIESAVEYILGQATIFHTLDVA